MLQTAISLSVEFSRGIEIVPSIVFISLLQVALLQSSQFRS